MSISNFVTGGIMFHKYGKRDVSLALICSALDATAKKMFPRENNNQRNKKFIKRYMRIISEFGFPGVSASGIRIKCLNIPNLKTDSEGYVGIEDIIYHTIRCGLIHECEIENQICFTDRTQIGNFDGVFKVPNQIFWGLALATILCKKNNNEICTENTFLHIRGITFQINELWGKENELEKLITKKIKKPTNNKL